jgi:hypothetical protein
VLVAVAITGVAVLVFVGQGPPHGVGVFVGGTVGVDVAEGDGVAVYVGVTVMHESQAVIDTEAPLAVCTTATASGVSNDVPDSVSAPEPRV